MSRVKKLLIILPNWIGDAVMATPLLFLIKDNLQNHHITLAGQPHITELFNEKYLSDTLLTLNISRRSTSTVFNKINKIREAASAIRQVEADKVLLLPGSLSSAISTVLSGIPVKLGYNRDWRKLLLTDSIPHPDNFRKFHRVKYYLRLAQLLPELDEYCPKVDEAISPESFPLHLQTTTVADNFAQSFFKEHNLNGTVIAIHAGGAYGPSKRWAPEFFVNTLAKAASKIQFSVLITGSKDDLENGKAIAQSLNKQNIRTVTGAGETKNVNELAALLKRSTLFLSNDSGPMHIAAALRIPQIAIFTSTSTSFTSPWNVQSCTFSSSLNCSPCFQRDCKLKPKADTASNFPCHESISVGEVADKIVHLLSKMCSDSK